MSETYDAGLLSKFGGGDVSWWHDYIRAELGSAHEFYDLEIERLGAENAKLIDKNNWWITTDDARKRRIHELETECKQLRDGLQKIIEHVRSLPEGRCRGCLLTALDALGEPHNDRESKHEH